MRPDDESALLDVADAARLIIADLASLSQFEFEADAQVRDAVMYRLVIMGEAVKRLSGDFRDAHPSMRWSAIAGLRDILVHRYDRVDVTEVWNIALRDVPELLAYIQPLLLEES
jgi:uncharacterized protein with HEPN domain